MDKEIHNSHQMIPRKTIGEECAVCFICTCHDYDDELLKACVGKPRRN